MRPASRIWLLGAAMVAAVAVYLAGAWRSPLFDPELARRRAYLDATARMETLDQERERQAAERYWQANPDVAWDPYFGRAGTLGILGAREHFQRHGRIEGRSWPATEDSGQGTEIPPAPNENRVSP